MTDTSSPQAPYRVLARTYRPTDFSALIGQEVLVRTLSNAIRAGRIAHAFLLTGIRGIGKTTTARIIARALNCIGPDGKGGPTTEPCGMCEHCTAIAADRHVDVLEMDAASRTGVNDIREIIENVQYKPVSARYKIYIIDEVHMLSNSAFNALLKTLEEPPPHVKFIFATTEIRKIPVTVLSRCQRFDLRRVEVERLQEHLANIAAKEKIEAEPAALAMIARAAEGSVRDALSLLDRAIAHSDGKVTAEEVQSMVGLADRGQLFDLYEKIMEGQVSEALEIAHKLYYGGSDALLLLSDLLDLTHFLTRLSITPSLAEDISLPEIDRQRGAALTTKLSMASLGRCWQMLLKGSQEVKQAPSTFQALEMVLIRLAYVSELPTPEEILRGAADAPTASTPTSPGTPTSPAPSRPRVNASARPSSASPAAAPMMEPDLAPSPDDHSEPALLAVPSDYRALAELFKTQREPLLYQALYRQVRLVQYKKGRLEVLPEGQISADFATRVSKCLQQWTGERWMVSLATTSTDAHPTLFSRDEAKRQERIENTRKDPMIAKVLALFPGAEIEDVILTKSNAHKEKEPV